MKAAAFCANSLEVSEESTVAAEAAGADPADVGHVEPKLMSVKTTFLELDFEKRS